ncbi:hypothetical protein KGQ72_00090 [Patescibacteria group bacterium]|nr:hypothetical protein [Patescibacteria group bacterium]
MLKLCKVNAAVFLPMLLGFYISYVFFDKGNVETARVVWSIVAAGIALAAGVFAAAGARLDEKIDSVTISLVASAYAMIEMPRDLLPGAVDSSALVMAVVFLLVAAERERLKEESILGCVGILIPGYGAFIGAPILFYKGRRRQKISAM